MSQAFAQPKKRVGRDLTEGPILQTLMIFTIPMILTNLLQQVYSIVDLIIIGKFVGSVGTVGVSTGGEVSDLLTPLATSVAMAGQIYIAQLVGAKDYKGMREAIGTMLTTMMLLSIVCMLIPIALVDPILRALNCPEEAFAQARDYLTITCAGMPFIFGYNAVSSMLRGIGESKRPLIFMIVAATVNIFADILFVAVFHMEAAGTAIATVLSQIGSFAAAFLFMWRKREFFEFELSFRYFRIHKNHLRVLLKLGVPQLVRSFCVRFCMLWVKAMINGFGLVVSATYSVGNKLEKFVDVFFQGYTGAGSAMIGQNLGARKLDRVKQTQKTALCCALFFAALAAVLFLACPRVLFGLFTNDAQVIESGVTFCQIMSIGLILHAIASAYKCMATGAGEAMLSFWIGILDGVGRIVACLIAVNVLGLGSNGYFWGAAFCHVFPGAISIAYYASGKWKTKDLLAESRRAAVGAR